jgi:energy-coupling factor transporter ATP-binding protein EcfA2
MAPFSFTRLVEHAYRKTSDLHSHFDITPYEHPPYSAACIPFRWMLRDHALGDDEGLEGIVQTYQLGFNPEREPELGFESSWVQERGNQLTLLDTFFSAIAPTSSLCLFYAKRTPLSDDPRRVIVGVGRVLEVGPAVEYKYTTTKPPLRGMLWDRNIYHSIRPEFKDGFLFPYQALLEKASEDPSLELDSYVAFAPVDHWDEFSFTAEHLSHDGAIASLLACTTALRRIAEVVPGNWRPVISWIDTELNRLWQMRGAFPGFGSVLSAFGVENGTLVAHRLAMLDQGSQAAGAFDPWVQFDQIVQGKTGEGAELSSSVGETNRKIWTKLPTERKALLKLLSRFAISREQATRYYQPTERQKAGISLQDSEILANPYRIYEADRGRVDALQFATIDRGVFPELQIQTLFPVPDPSRLSDGLDKRRVRGVALSVLESAANDGHTLLPRDWVVDRVRGVELSPACSLSIDALEVVDEFFPPVIRTVTMADGKQAYQVERFADTKLIISQAIKKRLKGRRQTAQYDWRKLINDALPGSVAAPVGDETAEERARTEKASALEELFSSRFSVLIGPAGTGKTTLLKVLSTIPEVNTGGVLMLAPTGKARVRMETQTGVKGAQTIAQFLNSLERYDILTGTYLYGEGKRSGDYKTVIIDECSMLTEEQLAATIEALAGVERFVLVGDPRQLPPIGAGRPFLDIVRHAAPPDADTIFPSVRPGYAELKVLRRQRGEIRDDLLFAQWFSGRPIEPAADEVWGRLVSGNASNVKTVRWDSEEELESRVLAELVDALELSGLDDETTFEKRLGGVEFQGYIYFNPSMPAGDGRPARPGAGASAESWQILSPVRAHAHGVDEVNRLIQRTFRRRAHSLAKPEKEYYRKVPRPLGAQEIIYGDKVISVINQRRYDSWPKISPHAYVANGDIGVVVGQFKSKKLNKLPWKAEVEFTSLLGTKIGYYPSEFTEEGSPPLELAYALTIHKAQGSEFGVTFVILPNPCRLLSRELMYTALTRHQSRLVILHQGDIRDFLKFSRPDYSEAAQRITNLFSDPKPVTVKVENQTRFLEERLIHRTERGELVRSKSELVIADKLYAAGINYLYEQPVRLKDGSVRYPDFTVIDDASGETVYWEHLGLLQEPVYKQRWEAKLKAYRASGILPFEEGRGERGVLVISSDDAKGGLDAGRIAELIRKAFYDDA